MADISGLKRRVSLTNEQMHTIFESTISITESHA